MKCVTTQSRAGALALDRAANVKGRVVVRLVHFQFRMRLAPPVSYTAMSHGSGEGDDAVLTDFLEAYLPTGNAESSAPSTTTCCSFLVMRERSRRSS